MDEIIKNNLQLKYKGIPTRIDLVQYTNAMRLVFVLTDYPMPSGATARIYVKKPSGKEVYNVATISGDTVTVSTTTQMTAEAGTNNAQLQIVKGSIVAASFVFCLHVQPNIAEDTAIESSNEYGVLDGLIADANNLIDQARATLGGITPINNLTSTDASKPLAAPMGKLLDDKISSLNADLETRKGFISEPIFVGHSLDSSKWRWFKVLQQNCAGIYGNTNILFAVTHTYAAFNSPHGQGILSIQIRADDMSLRVAEFKWLANSGLDPTKFVITISDGIWALHTASRNKYNRVAFTPLVVIGLNRRPEGGDIIYSPLNTTEEDAPDSGIVSEDI